MSLQYQYKIMQKGNESVQNYQLESFLFFIKNQILRINIAKNAWQKERRIAM